MERIIPIALVGMVILSGIGATAFSIKDQNIIISNLTNDEYDMVIIAPETFTTVVQPLIDHKNAVGIKTTIKTVEEIYDYILVEINQNK